MIVKKEFLDILKKEFNLNIYEVKIWTALLTRGISTAGELADISGVPRSRCYDVLESLEKKSYIIMKIGKPIKYISVEPNEVIERVKKVLNEESGRKLALLENIKDTEIFDELQLLHKTGIEHFESSDISSSVRGRADINFIIKSMIKNANNSVVMVTTKNEFRRYVNLVKNILPDLRKKGIHVHIVGPYDNAVARRLNGKAKFIDKDTGLRFINIDKSELFFMTTNEGVDNENEAGVWIKSPFFISAFSKLFEGVLK